METTIRVNEGPLTFKHLILLGIAMAGGKKSSAPQTAAQRLEKRGTEASAGAATLQPEAPAGDAEGRNAASPMQMPSKAWKDVLLRTWKESSDDNVGLVAAGVAFYGFLAMVPLLGAIVLTYGLFASPETLSRNMTTLTGFLPSDVAKLIGEQLAQVVQTSGSKKGFGLLVALALALFSARGAVGGVITSLNIAYEEKEKRGFIKVNLLALAMTAAAVVLTALALAATAVMGLLDNFMPQLPDVVAFVLKLVSYMVLVAIAAAAAASLYRYGPSRDLAKWRWITPGTLLFGVAWVVLTAGFGFYVAHFGNYGATYGSLGGIVVLLTWMYLSAYALLFGAELNSELEHQTKRDTTRGPERPLGTRGAWSADHVAPAGGAREPEQTAKAGADADAT